MCVFSINSSCSNGNVLGGGGGGGGRGKAYNKLLQTMCKIRFVD